MKYTNVDDDPDSSSDESLPDIDAVRRRRIGWYAAVGGVVLVGVAMMGLVALGFTSKFKEEVHTSSAAPGMQTPSATVPRFLSSSSLMQVVAEQSVKSNPTCRQNSSLEVCNTNTLQPLLVTHMRKHVQSMPKKLLEVLDGAVMHSDSQEAVKKAVPHLADPLFHTLAKDIVQTMQQINGSTTEVAARRLTEKLKPRSSEMQDLRSKLFPGVPPVAHASAASDMLHTVLTARGLHLQHKGQWNMDLNVAMPQKRSLTAALESMPSGRALEEAIFAPKWPWEKAEIPGPPPKENFAADIVAALAIPLSHIVVSCMHHFGYLTIPYWDKVVMTIEEVLTFGALDFLPLIGFIIDMVFLWMPRGYAYPKCSKSEYPWGFLDRNNPNHANAFDCD